MSVSMHQACVPPCLRHGGVELGKADFPGST